MQFTSTRKVISLIVCNKIVVVDSEDCTKHKYISRVQCRDSWCFSQSYLLAAIALYGKGSRVSAYFVFRNVLQPDLITLSLCSTGFNTVKKTSMCLLHRRIRSSEGIHLLETVNKKGGWLYRNRSSKSGISFFEPSKTDSVFLNQADSLSQVMVRCTLVQALRLCTGRTAHRGSIGINLPFHDHGTRTWWGVSVTPRPALYPRGRPGTHCTGGWVGPRAGLDRCGKSRPHRDSIHGPSSP